MQVPAGPARPPSGILDDPPSALQEAWLLLGLGGFVMLLVCEAITVGRLPVEFVYAYVGAQMSALAVATLWIWVRERAGAGRTSERSA